MLSFSFVSRCFLFLQWSIGGFLAYCLVSTWFYHSCTPPTFSLWFLLCLWRMSFFGRFQHFFLIDGCSAVNCNFGVLVRRCEFRVLLPCHLASNSLPRIIFDNQKAPSDVRNYIDFLKEVCMRHETCRGLLGCRQMENWKATHIFWSGLL